MTLYENMARRASEDLRDTLDELERRRATLGRPAVACAARPERQRELRDVAFIYALIARSHAGLSEPQESAEAIQTLLQILEENRHELRTDAGSPDDRALAWLVAARDAQEAGHDEQAGAAYEAAREAVHNANLRWVIEQVARSLD